MTSLDLAIGFLLIVIGVLIGVLIGLYLGEKVFFTDRRHMGDDE